MTIYSSLLLGSSNDLVFALEPKDIATAISITSVPIGEASNFTLQLRVQNTDIQPDVACELSISKLKNSHISGAQNARYRVVSHTLLTSTPLIDVETVENLKDPGAMSQR